MMKTIATVILLSIASTCFASGWNDFELNLGDGYRIFKMNSMDVCLGNSDGTILIHSQNNPDLGAIVEYVVLKRHIFTRHIGRKNRNTFIGDTFQVEDQSKSFYFILFKGTNHIVGPMTTDQFIANEVVVSEGKLNWTVPANPNYFLPIVGGLIFLAVSIPILAVKFYWISC